MEHARSTDRGADVHFAGDALDGQAMLRTLRQSRLDNSRDAEMMALTSVDRLVLDDFALERTGRASMIVTSNRDTAAWLAMFDDVLLAQSAVDRFKNAAYDFVIAGESYRPRLKPTIDSADPPPETPGNKARPHPPVIDTRHPRSRSVDRSLWLHDPANRVAA